MQYPCYATVFAALFVLRLSNAVTHDITHAKFQCDGKEKASALLDVANDFINKSKNLFPDCIDDDFQCGRKEKSLAFLEVASNLITGAKKSFPNCPDPECPKVLNEKPMDCSEVLHSGKNKSGVNTIWPRSRTMPDKGVSVYCDMVTDGGGWTVIQRRGQFSTIPKEDFYVDWNSYKIGFGNLTEEFWLGNDNIHVISNQANYTIRFDLTDDKGEHGYAQYDTFWIEDELSNYTLRISGYNGNVNDSMINLNRNMKFSTKDRKNDESKGESSCAEQMKGGWWYRYCGWSNLNGLNQPGVNEDKGIHWFSWRRHMCLSEVEMKLRPRNYGNKN